MAKLGRYSVKEIQARQVQEFNTWALSQPKVEQPVTKGQPQTSAPAVLAQPQMPVANSLPPQMDIPTAPEYMAQEQANITTILGTQGTENVYYSSKVRDGWAGTWDAVVANPFKNWARRTYANINNPYDILPAPTAEQNEKVKERTEYYKKNTEASWDYKINKFVNENIFGIDMDEIFQTAAVKDVAKEAGVNTGTKEFVQSVKAAGSTIAFGVLGAAEWAVRNGAAVVKGLDETADEVAGADKENIQPILNGIEKFQRAAAEGQFDAIGEVSGERLRVSAQEGKFGDIAAFAKVINSLSPVEILKDAGRLVLHLDKLPEGNLQENVNRQLAGSQAIYSRVYDDALNQEYIRRYEEGESPQKLVMELQNPIVELAGGLLLDPTTWITGKSAAKLFIDPKTGARVIQDGIKSASLSAIDNGLLDVRMVKEVKQAADAISAVAEGTTPKTRQEAMDVIQSAYKITKETMDTWKNRRGITSLTSDGKQKLVIEQTKDFFATLAANAANHPDGMDIVTGTVDAMITLAKGEGDTAKAFSALLNSPLGQIPLSPRGMRVANMLAGIDEVTPAIQKAIDAKDIKGLANLYADQLEKVTKKTILSVEEMRGAGTKITELTTKIGGNEVIEKARVAIKGFDTASENLTKVKTVLSDTRQSVKEMLDGFKGLAKKKSGEVKYLQGIRSSVLDNADQQIQDLSVQLKALKKTAKNDETLKTIDEIKGTLAEIRDLKKTAMVEDIGKAKGTYESAKETLRLLALRLDKDIKSVTAAVERASVDKSRAFDALKDLSVDGRPVKNLIEDLDEAVKISEEYKNLPAIAKFVNGANELGKKTWLKPMKLFSELYFGLNRFSYPMRNVFSTIPGMAYEFGLKDALEIAVKGITGAQIEKVGVQTLTNLSSEIEKLVGFVPEAFKRGDTAVGEFVKTDKKYFGFIRGGGEVAQLSEQIMGAQIMYKTVKREMRNALKNGVIPDTRTLEAAGLSADDGKKLVQYALEHGGDAGKIVDDFRKFMGGAEETFRHITTPERLDGFLDSIGNGANSTAKELNNLRMTAKSAEEFRAGAEKIWEKVNDFGDISRTEPTNLSDDVPTEFVDDIKNAQMFKYASEEVLDNFERVLQGWRNAEASMLDSYNQMAKWFRNNGVDTGAYMTDVTAVLTKKYARQDAVRNLVRKISDAKDTLTSQQIYDELNTMEDFKISKMTELDPKKVTPKEMVKVMWESYFAWSGEQRAVFAAANNDGLVEILGKMASQIGTDVPTAARMANVPYQKAVDDFNYAKELYKESKIDTMIALRRKVKPNTTLQQVDEAAIKLAGYKGKSHLFNDINKYRRAQGLENYQTWQQVPFWEVEDQVRRLKGAQGLIPELGGDAEKVVDNAVPDATQAVEAVTEATPAGATSDLISGNYVPRKHPPIAPDKPVTPSRMVFASLDKAKHYFDEYIDNIATRWGETSAPAGAIDDKVEVELSKWVETLTQRVSQAKTEAALAAQATRDAMLYDYRKQLWNVAAQYVSPFHYFHASASNQWLQNVAADPKWGAIYIDYKEYMASRHAGLPDFWKQNVSVSGLPGYDKENPLFFNIEASVNPLYQMIGQDFNDPNRRKDWLSTTVDDLSKVIPGLYQPLQWVVAANLAKNGEADAAKRWAGRLIPQTKIFKSVTNALGIDIPLTKYNELDPFVSIFSDGLDPFEESRVNRYLSQMPGVSEEAKIEAAHSRSGDLWEQAVRGSLSARAPVEFASYFLGVGYKPRTSADIETDQFYNDYRKLITARTIMPEQEYRDAWDAMRQKYPYMDALLIGRKGGEDRDTAFAYNVLGRIPPSEMTDIAKFVHVEPYMIESFYSNKGDLSKMLPQDRARFMAAITDLSAMLKMPDGATKQEWTEAKREYANMQDRLKADFGENILDQIYQYYELSDGDKKDYLQTFPDVDLAMQAQTEYIAGTPILSAYYGGIDTVARYYSNQMYIQLEKDFGKDIQEKVDWYYYLNENGQTKEANAFKKAENLKAYFDQKDKLQQIANLAAINAASKIPEGKDYAIRPEFQPQSGIQENTLDYATTDQQAQLAGVIYNQLSEPMRELLGGYYGGGELPYAVGKRLEYIGSEYGLSKQEVLRLLGLEVLQ